MAIDYPDWLPLAQKSNKNVTSDTGFRTDQPQVGAPIFQKLTDDLKSSFSLTWIFTRDQHRAFYQWLRSPNYLDNGNQWFSMRLSTGTGDSGLEVQELHFTAYPTWNQSGSVFTWTGDSVLSFTLDTKRSVPATVFNRSNTVEAGYSLSYDMTLPGGYDGVEVQYRNPVTNKQAYVRYRVRNNQIEAGQPLKAKKFEMMYIRDGFQADFRAKKECLRLLYSRMSMAITALADGEWVNVGDMVQVPDTYDTNQQAGYIVSRNGNAFETSEHIKFSGSMFVVITDSLGNSSARYAASPRNDTAYGFIADLPQIPLNIFDGYEIQSPSRYFIATTEELNATQWVISEKQPNSDGTTALTLAEYSDFIYP